MKILLIGQQGQVGYALNRSLQPLGEVIAVDRTQLDLSDNNAIQRIVQNIQPQLIVNAAAYTAVDRAEQEPELAHQINAIAPGLLAELAHQVGAVLVHYSTDYVFDGSQRTPYQESDPTCPLGVYGRTKLAGEQAIQSSGCTYLILRTSWVYGLRGKNFLLTMLRLGKEREELRVVQDQQGIPTPSGLIAEQTALILAQAGGNPLVFFRTKGGIYNLTCTGATTWYDFTRAIFAHTPDPSRKLKTVTTITTDQYPTPAARPAYSVLATDKIRSTFRLTLPTWEEALVACLETPVHGA